MTDQKPTTAGPRQTCDRAKHPALGEGWAIYDNGPASFVADSGETLQCERISFASSGVDGSRLRARIGGADVLLDVTKRQRGDSHTRKWHPRFGSGWLVAEGRKDERGWPYRFDPDEGASFRWFAVELRGGNGMEPKNAKKWAAERKANAEWTHWVTHKTRDGETLMFRDEPPPPEEPKPSPQASLFGDPT